MPTLVAATVPLFPRLCHGLKMTNEGIDVPRPKTAVAIAWQRLLVGVRTNLRAPFANHTVATGIEGLARLNPSGESD
jgi:hypothetical protein